MADVAFSSNHWLIAVNYGVSGTNRNTGQVYLYEGAAISSLLSDEVAIGIQRIGFLFPVNGIVWMAYQDLSSSGGYKIGYIAGSSIKDVKHFTGTLPNFAQKTLYKNLILLLSNAKVWAAGAVIDDLPFQISQHADGGYATVGALAAPFGTPLIASTDGGSNHQLANFSGYTTSSTWKSIVVPLMQGRLLGYIDEMIVVTPELGANARCDVQLEYNQQQANSGTAKSVTGTGKRIHRFGNMNGKTVEDLNVSAVWSNGNTTNACPVRKIFVLGHYKAV